MNITTRSDSAALFVFSYSYSAVTSKIKAHHSSKIKLCESPFHQLLRARSYVNRLPSQQGRQRHRRPCQHHKKWQKPCLINTPGAQSHAFPWYKQIVCEVMESCGSFGAAQGAMKTCTQHTGHLALIITLAVHTPVFSCHVWRPETGLQLISGPIKTVTVAKAFKKEVVVVVK